MIGRNSGYFRRDEKKPWLRYLIILGLVLGLAFFLFTRYANGHIRKGNEALMAGDYETAETHFTKVVGLPLSKGKGEDALGALALIQDDEALAAEHFKKLLASKPGKVSALPDVVFGILIKSGKYHQAALYAEMLQNWKDESLLRPLALDLAAVALGNRDLDEASKQLERVPAKLKKSDRFANVEKLVAKYQREKQIPVMSDRNGATIVSYNLESKDYSFDAPQLFEGWKPAEGSSFGDSLGEVDKQNHITTTIDLNLQKAAHQAMKDYQGTMLLTDPKTGEILVAYGTDGYNPFTAAFEPGSVIKVLTYGFFLEDGGDVKPYAPKRYKGNVQIGGKIFYDWTEQGMLETIDEGMAVSCNLMFAQMGIDLSLSKWMGDIKKLFNGDPHSGFLGDGYYGRLLKEPDGAWELGRAAIGLEFLETTSLGTTLIALAVANQGEVQRPHLYKEFTNIEGTPYKTTEYPPVGQLFSAETSAELKSSMAAAVTDRRGTARRARVDFVESVMKTGTSGDRPFNSVMVGHFPKDNPKVAFSFFLHMGGKCEINGGRVAKRLQEQIKALAPEYLE